jgi:ATP-binding cassette subfamily B protein RaxB
MRGLELVRQTEVTECGLACLAMVAAYHGKDVNLAGLRARFGTSTRGVTLRTLIRIAGELGLSSRAVRMDLEALEHLAVPAIAHWDFDHFVVIDKVKAGEVVVFDPRIGVRRYDLAEVSKRFTGVALEVEPAPGSERITARVPRVRLRDLARDIPHFQLAIGQIAVIALVLQIIYLAPTIVIQNIIDKVLPGADVGLLNVFAIVLALIFGLATLCDALSSWVSLQFGHNIAQGLTRRLFVHMLRLPLEWFEARGTGDVLAKIQSQRPIQELFISTIPLMLSDAVVVVTTSAMLLLYSLWLSAVVFACLALAALTSFLFYPTLRKREEEVIAASVAEHGYVVETLRSMRVIRTFGGEAERQASWRNQFTEVVNSGIRAGKLRIYLRSAQSLVNGFQTVLITYLAARMIMTTPDFTVGMLFAFLFFRQSLVDKANGLIQKVTTLRLANLHLDRLSDVLTATPEPPAATGALDDDIRGSIKLSKVWFRYGPHDAPVIRGADLEIKAGEFVVIVGPTGGGKTSLVKLMAGFAESYAGEILVDGTSIEQFGRSRWRQHVGTVMQDDSLISGTVADNISFFDPDVDLERVKAVAAMAAIADDIARMPMRYWTWVGDMGSALSGGQRQRLLIARALYNDPKVLFLDEGTANLDTDTEKAIVATIAELPITRVVITHRPALVARANRVITIHGGIVAEAEGNSEDLARMMALETLISKAERFVEPPVPRGRG